jgi:hypothetical protein
MEPKRLKSLLRAPYLVVHLCNGKPVIEEAEDEERLGTAWSNAGLQPRNERPFIAIHRNRSG